MIKVAVIVQSKVSIDYCDQCKSCAVLSLCNNEID